MGEGGCKENAPVSAPAVLHDSQPDFAEIVHAQGCLGQVVVKHFRVLVLEQAVEAHGFVQGCVRFLEVTDGELVVAEIEALGAEK